MANCFCKFILNTFCKKKNSHKPSYTEKISEKLLDDSQEIFNDYKAATAFIPTILRAIDEVLYGDRKEPPLRHDSVISQGRSELNFLLDEKKKLLPIVPAEIMRVIFKHVNEESRQDLISCLLVDKFWCSNVLPLLWNRPFDIVSRDNRHKLIRTYISCLEEDERRNLSLKLKTFRIKIPFTAKALFKYETYLKEFSYNNLYLSADAGIRKSLGQDCIGQSMHVQTLLIVGSLCQLIMRNSTNMTYLVISKFIGKADLPEKTAFINSRRSLSNLSKFQFEISSKITTNGMSFLQTISNSCLGIRHLDIKLSYINLNDEIKVMEMFSRIIISQGKLNELLLSGARAANGLKMILQALSQSESLHSLEFKLIDFSEVDLSPLKNCKSLKHLTVQYCQGLTTESTASLLQAQFSLESLKFGCPPVSYSTQLALLTIFGKSIKRLTIDLLNQETIFTILNSCQEIRHLNLENCFMQKPIKIGKLLHGLIKLEKLKIFINVKSGEYENLILESKDIPSSLDCLVLECGFTTIQLDELLKNCKLNSLYINYLNFESSHFRVIAEYAKRTKELKILGIESNKRWMDGEQEAWELKRLRDNYGIFCYIK
ncbi:31228_t:CDS:1 [Racocetra persica]|uniref:31228_t:CDS:1 n=1 Tax=Racocetra persica TaxID=160502 RepID=A0ACA9KBM8_9GLOM|nr:31228_t:CDS:1 [Racocetra persica]